MVYSLLVENDPVFEYLIKCEQCNSKCQYCGDMEITDKGYLRSCKWCEKITRYKICKDLN